MALDFEFIVFEFGSFETGPHTANVHLACMCVPRIWWTLRRVPSVPSLLPPPAGEGPHVSAAGTGMGFECISRPWRFWAGGTDFHCLVGLYLVHTTNMSQEQQPPHMPNQESVKPTFGFHLILP